ncbi:ABC transporter permease [bacterium]|nr:ABC transporter permease [bacterium]
MSVERIHNPGSRLSRELAAVRGFLLRDVDLTKRYLLWDIVWLIYNLINAIIIGLIGVSSGAAPAFAMDHQGYVLYLCIGAVIWSYLGVVFIFVAQAIAWERWEGTLEYTFMAPVHQFTRLAGMCLASVIYGLIRIVIMMALLVWIFDLDLRGANFGAALMTLGLSTIAMLGMGLVAAVFPLLSPEKGAQATEIILACTLLVSGTYFPISVLPALLQPLAWICPPYWALLALRQALLEHAPLREMLPNLGMLLLSGLIYVPLGYLAFRWAENYAKRTGLLKRNG